MTQLSDLEYLRLSKGAKFGYKLGRFFTGIPKGIGHFFLKIGQGLKKGAMAVGREVSDIVSRTGKPSFPFSSWVSAA